MKAFMRSRSNEVLHEVAQPLGQLAPAGGRFRFGGRGIALARKVVHWYLLGSKGGRITDMIRTGPRSGFIGRAACGETVTACVFTTRLCACASARLADAQAHKIGRAHV